MSLFPEDRMMLLIDGNSLAYAAYYALPPLSTSDGTLTGALKGFVDSFFKLLEYNPSHVVVMFDSKNNRRKDNFPEYKANRKAQDESLYLQFPLIKEFLRHMKVTVVEKDGYEADDLIASFVLAFNEVIPIAVATRDRDLFRLCCFPSVYMIYTATQGGAPTTSVIGREEIKNRMGIYPEQINYFKALAGDASDNIKGVPGIGVKTAVKLLQKYQDLDSIIDAAKKKLIKPPSVNTKIVDNLDAIDRSMKMVSFITLPVRVPIEYFEVKEPNRAGVNEFFSRLEFSSRL